MPRGFIEKTLAPDFQLTDTEGKLISLAGYRMKKIVVLVLVRGFM